MIQDYFSNRVLIYDIYEEISTYKTEDAVRDV